jgi:hypothetical protein
MKTSSTFKKIEDEFEFEFEDDDRNDCEKESRPAPLGAMARHLIEALILRLQSSSSSIRILSFFSNLHAFTPWGAPAPES